MKRYGFLKSLAVYFTAILLTFTLFCQSAFASEGLLSLSAPKGLKAVTDTTSQITITWNKVSGATSYQIYRSTGSAYKKIATVKSTKYKDTGLKSATKHSYKVRAVKGSKKSGYSSVKSAYTRPDTPTGLKAQAQSSTQSKLSWNAVARASAYKIYVSRNGAEFAYTATVKPPAISFTQNGLSGSYRYKVSAVAGTSTEGVQSAATAALSFGASVLPAPGNFSAKTYNYQSVQLTYDAVQNAAKYRIYYSKKASSNLTDYSNFDFASVNCRVIGLDAGTVYYFRIAAVDAQGKQGTPTGFIAAQTAASPGNPPQPSFYLYNISQVSTVYRMNFYRGTNPIYPAVNDPAFDFYVGTTSSNMTYQDTANPTQYFYYDVTPGKSLWYGFRATYGTYKSTMQTIHIAALGKPTGVTANGVGTGGKVNMSWASVYAAARYNLYYSVGVPYPGQSWIDFKATAGSNLHSLGNTTGTSVTVTGVPSGLQYYFFVLPADSSGVEGWFCGYAQTGVV